MTPDELVEQEAERFLDSVGSDSDHARRILNAYIELRVSRRQRRRDGWERFLSNMGPFVIVGAIILLGWLGYLWLDNTDDLIRVRGEARPEIAEMRRTTDTELAEMKGQLEAVEAENDQLQRKCIDRIISLP